MKNIKYIHLLPAVLLLLSGCEKGNVASPAAGDEERVRVYISPYEVPLREGSRSTAGEESASGVSVSYNECVAECSTRGGSPAVGELSPEQEGELTNLGFMDMWLKMSESETSPVVLYFHYWYLSVADYIAKGDNYIELDMTPEEFLPQVGKGHAFQNSLIMANMQEQFTGEDRYLEYGERWKELDDYLIVDYPTQESVTDRGIIMEASRYGHAEDSFNSIYLERKVAKVEISVSVDRTDAAATSRDIRLSSVQLRNVPKTSCLFSQRSPMPEGDDKTVKVGSEYYMDYTPLENSYEVDGTALTQEFVEGGRYVWYMPENYDDYGTNVSKAKKDQDLTLANADNLAYLPTYFLIKGELSDGADWEPFELTVCVVDKWSNTYYHEIKGNTLYRINVKLNVDLPDTADDARIVYPDRAAKPTSCEGTINKMR